MKKISPELYGNYKAIEKLNKIIASKRIPHALLFIGPEGIGKFYYTLKFIKAINESSGDIIDNYLNKLLEPYIKYIFPVPSTKEANEENINEEYIIEYTQNKINNPFYELLDDSSKSIPIQIIRNLNNFLSLQITELNYRAVIIDDVHLLTLPAQQAFLKILEEPPSGVIFILLTSQQNLLLDTIKSRSQIINFAPLENKYLRNILHDFFNIDKLNDDLLNVSDGQVFNYLKYQDNDIKKLIEDVLSFLRFSVTKKYNSAYQIAINYFAKDDKNISIFLKFLHYWLFEAIEIKYNKDIILFQEQRSSLEKFSKRYEIHKLITLSQNLEKYSDLINKNINLNILLFNIILEFSQLQT
jgi:DNA polymerase-3 subunit delta'